MAVSRFEIGEFRDCWAMAVCANVDVAKRRIAADESDRAEASEADFLNLFEWISHALTICS